MKTFLLLFASSLRLRDTTRPSIDSKGSTTSTFQVSSFTRDSLKVSTSSVDTTVVTNKNNNNDGLFGEDNDPSNLLQEVESDQTEQIRPFEQNWWPVAALSSLDASRPNALQVLGKKLVAYRSSSTNTAISEKVQGTGSDEDGCWSVLDDRCSHRFAPLSEGRVVPLSSLSVSSPSHSDDDDIDANGVLCALQCSYHGWAFDRSGRCTNVPQDPSKVGKARKVQSYPVRTAVGILWVWTDPDSYETIGKSIRLPIDPLLERWVTERGNSAAFMRDLPYGMEILGENLLDLSHLPWAHHSVGGLDRSLGGELPTRMLSESEKRAFANQDRAKYGNSDDPLVLPLYQAKIVDAHRYDPILMSLAQRSRDNKKHKPFSPEEWDCAISYFDPTHVRYTRQSPNGSVRVELFMCPTSEGRSRVFLYNVFEGALQRPATNGSDEDKPDSSLTERVMTALNPSTWKESIQKIVISRVVADTVRGHMIAHSIFDGDGIFLHMQGNRMQSANLTYRDYSTPSSCDVLLNAYRRFLDAAARRTSDETVSKSVVGAGQYTQDMDRAAMLDRYNTHTKHCPDCRAALQKARKARSLAAFTQTALLGGAGASTTALVAAGVATVVVEENAQAAVLAQQLFAPAFIATSALWLAVTGLVLVGNNLDKRIQSFIFEDYVHAEKV